MEVCRDGAGGDLRSACSVADTPCECAQRGEYLGCGWSTELGRCEYGRATACEECDSQEHCAVEGSQGNRAAAVSSAPPPPTPPPTPRPTPRPTRQPTPLPTMKPTVPPTVPCGLASSPCECAATACACAQSLNEACGWDGKRSQCREGKFTTCEECMQM